MRNGADTNKEEDHLAKQLAASGTKILFPIGGKLVLIISLLLLTSLSTITILVSVFMNRDIRATAEENNFTVNQRSAAEVETTIKMIRADTLTLLNILSAIPNEALMQEAAHFFFEQNTHIAAIVTSEPTDNWELINSSFFSSNGVQPERVPAFIEQNSDAVRRAEFGTELLKNGTPVFGIPMLVLLGSWRNGVAMIIFFSAENITENFGTGTNASFMVNETGDALVHPDQELIRNGANLSNDVFVQLARRSTEQQVQTQYTDADGVAYFGAFQRLSVANLTVFTHIQSYVVFEGILATTRRNIYLTVAVLFLSILFIWFFSKTISKPLEVLTVAAERIEEGDYHLEHKTKNKDETGVLMQSFVNMSHGLANFERFTNKAIVRVARKGKLPLGGVSKMATVAFIFIRDFSEMAKGLNAGELVQFINEYMLRMVPCITNTGGVVDKFLTHGGVIVMALWGTVESAGSPEADALNCMRAVLMMRASLKSLNQEWKGKAVSHIKMGCGINVGEVVAGQMGSDDRIEYTVIGDTVNLAARFEGPNDLFDTDILITENVHKLIGSYLLIEEMPSIEVKGKIEPLRVFSVVNMRDTDQAAQILKDLESIPKTSSTISRRCVGRNGPHTMAEVRERW
jgi:adenylate cyclase